MITRNAAGGTLSSAFITNLQSRYQSPRIVFKFATDSTTNTNEALDATETVIDVVDNSVFSDNDIIIINDSKQEYLFVVNATVGVNQIQVTRGYGISVADTHNTNQDIYILNEYDVLGISDISIDQNFGASEAVVEVSNADQSWNIFLSDKTNHGNVGNVELKFDALAENMIIFRGLVDHVEYSDQNMSCFIYLYDRLADKLDEEIGDPSDDVDYTDAARLPSAIIWDLLTVQAGLDSTASTANVDIDYASYDAWATVLAGDSFSLRARLTGGHTYRSAVQAILYLCSSYAFLTNEGRIAFDYRTNDAVAGDDTWTQSEILTEVSGSKVDGNRPYTDKSLVNWQNTAYGYDPVTGVWTGTFVNQDAGSQSVYGVQAIAEANPLVWHEDQASATGGSNWVEEIHADPKIFTELTTWLYGYRIQIGDVIDLTDSDYGWANNLMKVERIISINLTDFVITVLLRE